jgi:hypothetical protein
MLKGNHITNFEKASHHLKIAGHMMHLSKNILYESSFLPKILEELHKCANFLVISILHYEAHNKNIVIYRDAKMNFKMFREKIGPMYVGKEKMDLIIEIFLIHNVKMGSPIEFIKNDSIIFMEEGDYKKINRDKIEEFIENMKRSVLETKIKLKL